MNTERCQPQAILGRSLCRYLLISEGKAALTALAIDRPTNRHALLMNAKLTSRSASANEA
ncbi:hypothetical protein T4B_6253 [Trichinella pseudospiralis]|uniref:Uncharacterized protein n=2 Tax=Trichinella pseudospiralis TaxID=6337 RepID=A0A0V1FQ57_TRIPS|nr:hypothetical protein T4D_7456 [Trichinella pseudospiralis]KRZ31435.1 hypothetical protein T4B_6253 [Trichinella pseudospiralis]